MARSGAGRLNRRILEEIQNNRRTDSNWGAWALTSRLIDGERAEGNHTVDCYLTETQRGSSEVETRRKKDETNTKEKTNQAPRVVEGIEQSLFGGPQCVAGGVAIIGVFGADLLEKTVVGKTRMQGKNWLREAVRDARNKLSLGQVPRLCGVGARGAAGDLDFGGAGDQGVAPLVRSPHCDVDRGASPRHRALLSPDWLELAWCVLVSGPFRATTSLHSSFGRLVSILQS